MVFQKKIKSNGAVNPIDFVYALKMNGELKKIVSFLRKFT